MSTVELRDTERRAFEAEATSFLEAHAERRPRSTGKFVWGEGADDIGGRGAELGRAQVEAARAWRAQVFDAGFGWLGGPAAYGGGGRHPELDRVYRELEAGFDVPDQSPWAVAWDMVAPAVLTHGSDELKRRVLRPIHRGDLLCSQLLSEPEAGSDLAGLRTRAVPDGDEWVVNGQKVWSSYAHLADVGQLMARTEPDAPKHQGLTMFLLPLDTPGVEIRPLKQMNGGAEFNEIFLNDVRVPDANRVGARGSGWRAVLTTLMSERVSVGSGRASMTPDVAAVLVEMARQLGRAGDAVVRQGLAEVHVHASLIRWMNERLDAAPEPGAEGSILKLLQSQQGRRCADLAGLVAGAAMVADTGEWGTYSWSRFLCSTPASRIAGGTDEIQRNILSERVLGLPKEPSV